MAELREQIGRRKTSQVVGFFLSPVKCLNSVTFNMSMALLSRLASPLEINILHRFRSTGRCRTNVLTLLRLSRYLSDVSL